MQTRRETAAPAAHAARAARAASAALAAILLASAFAAALLAPAGVAASPQRWQATAITAGSHVPQASVTGSISEKRAVAASLASRADLPDARVLPTRARQQTTDYNCGPAVAQMIINYTRGISSTGLDGGARRTNWVTQATLQRWMKTSVLYGTGAPAVRRALNRPGALQRPFPGWTYALERTGGPKAFHDKVVTDVAVYEMPLALAVNPHMAKVGIYKLASWPDERPLARHWVLIRGYEGLWGSPHPIVHYSDSAGGYGGGTGNYWDLSLVLHDANDRNRGRIIW